jgi:hypothetical protein
VRWNEIIQTKMSVIHVKVNGFRKQLPVQSIFSKDEVGMSLWISIVLWARNVCFSKLLNVHAADEIGGPEYVTEPLVSKSSFNQAEIKT